MCKLPLFIYLFISLVMKEFCFVGKCIEKNQKCDQWHYIVCLTLRHYLDLAILFTVWLTVFSEKWTHSLIYNATVENRRQFSHFRWKRKDRWLFIFNLQKGPCWMRISLKKNQSLCSVLKDLYCNYIYRSDVLSW